MKQPDPYRSIIPLLTHSSNPEDPIPLLSSSFLTSLVSHGIASSAKTSPKDREALEKLYAYLARLTKNQDSGLQDIAVQQYSALLRTSEARQLFWKQRKETVDPLVEILRNALGTSKDSDSTLWSGAASIRSAETSLGGGVGLQLLYHVLLVLWQLSFEAELVGDDLEKYVNSKMTNRTVADTSTGTMKLYLSIHSSSDSPRKRRRLVSCCRR